MSLLACRTGRRTLAFFGCHNVNATRYLGYLFAVTFRAPYPRFIVLCDGLAPIEYQHDSLVEDNKKNLSLLPA